jgi:hypothetical protein
MGDIFSGKNLVALITVLCFCLNCDYFVSPYSPMSFFRNTVWFVKGMREYTKSGYEAAAKNFRPEVNSTIWCIVIRDTPRPPFYSLYAATPRPAWQLV